MVLGGAILVSLTCMAVVASCGDGRSSTSSTSHSPASPISAKATSLPLQPQGLAVGGDVQTRATDVIRVRLTEEQTKILAAACPKTFEVPSTGTCARALEDLAKWIVEHREQRCQPHRFLCGAVRILDDSDQRTLGSWGYFEISDNRSGKSLCSSEPNHLCLRVGIKTAEQLGEIAHTTPSPAPTSSPTPTPASSPTPTPTDDPSQEPTSNPATTATSSGEASSAAPTSDSSTSLGEGH